MLEPRSLVVNSTVVLAMSFTVGAVLAFVEWVFHPYANFRTLFMYMSLCSIVPSAIILTVYKKLKE